MNHNQLTDVMGRKEEIANARPARFSALRAAADAISRHNVDTAIVEVLNEAISRLVLLVYVTDAGGLCNVDSATGKFLIPTPMGRNGQKKWGVKPSEANVLRQILFDWQLEPPTLFFYDRSRRSWYCNLRAFSTIGIAKAWLRAHPITVALYRATRAKRLAR